ncbi:MAG: hypothetical protein HY650_06450 [Acidobacteria bacterium]|nr:hypothetical protein [Acidobacteriota bacterium]
MPQLVSMSLEGRNAWTSTTDRGWFIPDIATRSDTVLEMSRSFMVPARSVLKFRHLYNTENNYDGGVLEYSTDGVRWEDAGSLITEGGYLAGINGKSSPGLFGRSAWGGDSAGWHEVNVDLSALVGRQVQFRWRFVSDNDGADEGWWIADLVLE